MAGHLCAAGNPPSDPPLPPPMHTDLSRRNNGPVSTYEGVAQEVPASRPLSTSFKKAASGPRSSLQAREWGEDWGRGLRL